LTQVTKNALQLCEYAVENLLVSSIGELCDKIGLLPSGYSNIRRGDRQFTVEQLERLGRITKANMNWLFGLGGSMFRDDPTEKPLIKMRRALAELELQLAGKPLTKPLTPRSKKGKK